MDFKIVKCNRCNKKWVTRLDTPKQCPHCKSLYWNKPRVRKISAWDLRNKQKQDVKK